LNLYFEPDMRTQLNVRRNLINCVKATQTCERVCTICEHNQCVNILGEGSLRSTNYLISTELIVN